MRAMPTTHQVRHDVKRDDVIPLNDVPAFGVQFRFAKRVLQDMLTQFRHRRRSGGSSDRS
jgi:hypothetical protein